MAKSVEDKQGPVQNSSKPKRLGRVLPDTLSQNLLNATWFSFRFLGWCVRWTFACILFLAVMGTSAYLVFNEAIKSRDYVLVPDVTGLPITQAANVLFEAGLELGEQRRIVSDRVPSFHVILQRPSSNRVVRAGRKITLSISAGPQEENTPNFVGKSLDEALQDLESTRLRPGSVARLTNAAPVDTILAQDPEARARISTGGEVHLLVSDGPKTKQIFMPDILDRPIEKAQLILANLDLTVIPFSVDRAGQEYEVVLAQSPEPGTLLHEGQEVSFDVRLLPSSNLPNAWRKKEVRYTVPQRRNPALISVKLIDQQGVSTDLYPQPNDYVNGLPPLLPSGTVITIPDEYIAFANEATVEFFVDGELHTSYYFVGDAAPLVTVKGRSSRRFNRGALPEKIEGIRRSSQNRFRPNRD